MKTLLKLVALFAVVISTIYYLQSPKDREVPAGPEQPPEQSAKEEIIFRWAVLSVRQIRDTMKNPDSFRLEQAIRMEDGTLCVSYRAQNAFNAVIPGKAVVTEKRIVTSDREEFAETWNRRCAQKAGTDMRYIRTAL